MHYVSFLNKVSPIKLVLPVLTGRCWRRCSMVSAPSREMWPMLVCIGGHHHHRYHQHHHHHCNDWFEPKVWSWSPDHLSLLPDRHHSFKPGSILPTGETRFSRVAVCNLWFFKKKRRNRETVLTQPEIGLIGLILFLQLLISLEQVFLQMWILEVGNDFTSFHFKFLAGSGKVDREAEKNICAQALIHKLSQTLCLFPGESHKVVEF